MTRDRVLLGLVLPVRVAKPGSPLASLTLNVGLSELPQAKRVELWMKPSQVVSKIAKTFASLDAETSKMWLYSGSIFFAAIDCFVAIIFRIRQEEVRGQKAGEKSLS